MKCKKLNLHLIFWYRIERNDIYDKINEVWEGNYFRTSKGDKEYSIYTFDPVLQRKLDRFSKEYLELCKITDQTEEGSKSYDIEKTRVSIRVVVSCAKERKDFMKNVLLDNLKSW